MNTEQYVELDMDKKHPDSQLQKQADEIAKSLDRDYARYNGDIDGRSYWTPENATYKVNGIPKIIAFNGSSFVLCGFWETTELFIRHGLH